MACPHMRAVVAGDPQNPWGATVSVAADSGDFGPPMLLNLVPPGASASIRCSGGSAHQAGIVSWTPRTVTIRVPAPRPPDCAPPYEIELVIPRAGASDRCTVALTGDGPAPAVPVVRVPTIVALFEEQDFRGRALVAVPKDSPLGGPGGLPLDAGGIAQALGPVAALGGVLVPGGNVAGGVLASAILAPLAGLRAGENVRFERADANNQISDFYDLTYPQTGFHRWSAEDIMTSFVVVGEPRTVVHFFNAPDADSREGSFQVTVGNDRLVRCRSLRGQQPQSLPSEPPEAVTITMAPDFWKWTENVKTFENELSSLRFGG